MPPTPPPASPTWTKPHRPILPDREISLTPSYVEGALRNVGFRIEKTEVMLPGVTMLTTAMKPA